MQKYEFTSIDEALLILETIKKSGSEPKLIQFTIDFDNDANVTKKVITVEDGCVLVKKSQTIIVNEDTYIPHMQLFSTKQHDLENIIREGVMHDIIFSNSK